MSPLRISFQLESWEENGHWFVRFPTGAMGEGATREKALVSAMAAIPMPPDLIEIVEVDDESSQLEAANTLLGMDHDAMLKKAKANTFRLAGREVL